LTEVFAEVRGQAQDATSAEIFAALEPLPDEVALAAIQALANSGNYPIGEPPAPSAAAPGSSSPAVASPAGSSQGGTTAPGPSAPPGPRNQIGFSVVKVLGGMACCGLVGLVVLGALVKAVKRSRRRR
jgi:hypothetical protein